MTKVRGSGMGLCGMSKGDVRRDDAEAGGNVCQKQVRPEGAGHEEDDDVADDDGHRHKLKANDLEGRVVVERNEHYRVFPGTQRMSPVVLALAQRLATKRKSERRLI